MSAERGRRRGDKDDNEKFKDQEYHKHSLYHELRDKAPHPFGPYFITVRDTDNHLCYYIDSTTLYVSFLSRIGAETLLNGLLTVVNKMHPTATGIAAFISYGDSDMYNLYKDVGFRETALDTNHGVVTMEKRLSR